MMPWPIAKALFAIAANKNLDLDIRYAAARELAGARDNIEAPPRTSARHCNTVELPVPPDIRYILNRTAERRRKKGIIQ